MKYTVARCLCCSRAARRVPAARKACARSLCSSRWRSPRKRRGPRVSRTSSSHRRDHDPRRSSARRSGRRTRSKGETITIFVWCLADGTVITVSHDATASDPSTSVRHNGKSRSTTARKRIRRSRARESPPSSIPKYWPTWLGIGVLRVFEPLPHRLLYLLGRGFGLFVCLFPTSFKRIARRNLELCLPELDAAAREQHPARALRRPGLRAVRDRDQLVVVERTHPPHHADERPRAPRRPRKPPAAACCCCRRISIPSRSAAARWRRACRSTSCTARPRTCSSANSCIRAARCRPSARFRATTCAR